jgi:hypothetical protein
MDWHALTSNYDMTSLSKLFRDLETVVWLSRTWHDLRPCTIVSSASNLNGSIHSPVAHWQALYGTPNGAQSVLSFLISRVHFNLDVWGTEEDVLNSTCAMLLALVARKQVFVYACVLSRVCMTQRMTRSMSRACAIHGGLRAITFGWCTRLSFADFSHTNKWHHYESIRICTAQMFTSRWLLARLGTLISCAQYPFPRIACWLWPKNGLL